MTSLKEQLASNNSSSQPSGQLLDKDCGSAGMESRTDLEKELQAKDKEVSESKINTSAQKLTPFNKGCELPNAWEVRQVFEEEDIDNRSGGIRYLFRFVKGRVFFVHLK